MPPKSKPSRASVPEAALDRLVVRTVEYGMGLPRRMKRLKPVLIGLNHLAVEIGRTGSNSGAINKEFDALVEVLTSLAGRSGQNAATQAYVQFMLRRLNAVAVRAGAQRPRASEVGRSAMPDHRRQDFEVRYRIRVQPGGNEELVEERHGDRKGFAVSRKDYEAAVATLAETISVGEGMKFEQLHSRFVAHGGTDVASKYPLRVVLRFWRSCSPPLITRHHARYAPAAKSLSALRRHAADVWKQVAD